MTKKLVVVIDTQYDFMMPDGKLPVLDAEKLLVPGIRYLSNLQPSETVAVLFTFDTHEPEVYAGSPESEAFPIHCVAGEKGWVNVFNADLVNPNIPVYTLKKGVFNMWEESNSWIYQYGVSEDDYSFQRDAFFAELKSHGVVDIEIWGVAADFCVKWAIDGFVQNDFNVTVIEGLTAGIERQMEQVVAEEYNDKSVRLA